MLLKRPASERPESLCKVQILARMPVQVVSVSEMSRSSSDLNCGGPPCRPETTSHGCCCVFKPMRWRIVLGLVCVSLAGLAATIDPLLMRTLIDRALPQRSLRWALELAGGIGLCYFGRSALSAAGALVDFSIAQRCVRDLRVALLDRMNRLSADYHEQTPTGEKLTASSMMSMRLPIWARTRPIKALGRFCSSH